MDSLRTRFTVTVKLHTNWETHTNAITTALPYPIVRADSGTSSAAKAGASSVAMNRGPDAMRRMRAPAATELTIPPMPLHVAASPTATGSICSTRTTNT